VLRLPRSDDPYKWAFYGSFDTKNDYDTYNTG
jgi:hypothetical protein